MRTESPIHYDEDSKVWSVFRYDDVKRVISDKDFFQINSISLELAIRLRKR